MSISIDPFDKPFRHEVLKCPECKTVIKMIVDETRGKYICTKYICTKCWMVLE